MDRTQLGGRKAGKLGGWEAIGRCPACSFSRREVTEISVEEICMVTREILPVEKRRIDQGNLGDEAIMFYVPGEEL